MSEKGEPGHSEGVPLAESSGMAGLGLKTPLGLDGKPLVLRQPRDETRDYARDVWLRLFHSICKNRVSTAVADLADAADHAYGRLEEKFGPL